MLNKRVLYFLFCVTSMVFYSCTEKTYLGDKLINYPDLNKVLTDKWDMKQPYVYLKVSQQGNEKDSTQVQSTAMPWEEIKSIFAKANFHDEKLDGHYTIDVLHDTVAKSRTFFYKSLAPMDVTKSLSIVTNMTDNEMQSLYFDTAEPGFLNADMIKVLFIPKELIQIQKESADKILVETYYFPE